MPKSTDQDIQEFLTPGEASKRLYVTQRTLQRMADRGEIRAIKLPSGHRRYLRESIEAIRNGEKVA